MTNEQREIRDHIIASKCENCCLSCDEYKTAKEQRSCEVRKARGRITNRKIYKVKKTKSSE